ncbi:MAG TPA: acetyl-CoA acetyltransferase [Acidimicrobiales bacterium]|nr:acetyl-CoA acetyltransferase [Acidimicrobiales bacterium]
MIVGVGQLTRRPESAADATEPLAMMAEVTEAAADDSGAGAGLLKRIESARVIDTLAWRYPNPGALLAQRLGMPLRDSVKMAAGGNSPQMAVNDTALAIQRGELDAAVVVGAEAVYSRFMARKEGVAQDWTQESTPIDGPEPRKIGIDRPGTSEAEMARSMVMPTQIYPIFENALRARAGRSIEEHQLVISELWARFSEVASGNPYAWSPQRRTAEEIRTVGPDNRMIGFPYPKLMNANIQTDQAAAVIVCSVAAAEAAGVPRDRWVFIHAGADGHDHWFVSERDNLYSSPAIRACSRAVYELADVGGDDLAHVDLYSCFPCAVEVGADEFGLGLDRELTVTGGLTFAGGPGNNYVTHSIAAMTGVLRDDAGSVGLCTANGWYLTKHAAGVYSTEPPASGEFRHRDVQAEVDATPARASVADFDGPGTVESYTVMHERDGSPAMAIVACLTPDGRRTWANSNDNDLLSAMTREEFVGRPCSLSTGGVIRVS